MGEIPNGSPVKISGGTTGEILGEFSGEIVLQEFQVECQLELPQVFQVERLKKTPAKRSQSNSDRTSEKILRKTLGAISVGTSGRLKAVILRKWLG